MPTALITGSNRGLGLELARQYVAEGWRVIAACRSPGSATQLTGLGPGLEVETLDVTDRHELAALVERLAGRPVDVLINNAGIYGPRYPEEGVVDCEAWSEVFRVNTMAPLMVAEALTENVAASEQKRIATVSSGMGSIADTGSADSYIYRSSKAAVNMVMKCLALRLAPRGITVVVLHPGWVQTDMGGAGADIEAGASAAAMRAVIDGLGPRDSGRFYRYDGSEIPW